MLALRDASKLCAPPQLVQYDNWGRRVDELRTSEGWRRLKDIYHREGLVAIPYERRYKEHSRPYGFAKLFVAAADSDVVRLFRLRRRLRSLGPGSANFDNFRPIVP